MTFRDPEARRAYHRHYYLTHEGAGKRRQPPKLTDAERKAHKAANDRAYVAANAERIKARRVVYRLANGQAIRERDRLRRLADPERARQKATEGTRRFRARHPDRMRELRRAWLDDVPLREAAVRAAMTANRRARMYGSDGQIGYETVLELWRREPVCVDCGEGRGVDHVIPFSRGGSNTSGNLANRCRSCNSRKGRRLPEEMAA